MNSPSPRLSLIIPVHNGGGNLQLCLDALAASSRQPDELIMVDDASTDGSGDLARKFGARVIRLEGLPRGPGFARNRGAEVAEGELLAFVDGDVAVH
jgi:glycosyltransferase involved in cell wall biosynthesis